MAAGLPSAEVFIATSLDGFIAREDGDIGWLTSFPVPEGEDFGYKAFSDGIGAMVMGRQSLEKVLGFPEWPYAVPVVVMSRAPEGVTVPEALRAQVRVTSDPPEKVLRDLGAQGVDRVYIDGGQIIRAFLAASLIRRLIVTMIPLLLGQGRPLWGHVTGDIPLRMVAARPFANGFVQLEYHT